MRKFRFVFNALGGSNELVFHGTDPNRAIQIFKAVLEDVQRIEKKYSRYQPQSILSQINRSAGEKPWRTDEETCHLLAYAQLCYQVSDGLFDITSGVLRRAWNFSANCLPQQAEIDRLLPLVGWDKVEWHPPDIFLRHTGMEIDFGGIGKEYAVDRGAVICLDSGVEHGFFNMGGDLRVIGPQPDGSPWWIGIRHPRQQHQYIASYPLLRGALATSGDYERFINYQGKYYSHILHPRTGWPIADGCQSVTVLAPQCLVAGSNTTISMLHNVASARNWLAELGLPFVYIDHQGVLHGLANPIGHLLKAC